MHVWVLYMYYGGWIADFELWMGDADCGWWMVDGEKGGAVKMCAILLAFIII